MRTFRILVGLAISLAMVRCGECGQKEVASDSLIFWSDGLCYEVNSEQPFTGIAVTYNGCSGWKESECEYLDGQRHGKLVIWYENGKKKDEQEYRNDELVSARSWDEYGQEKDGYDEINRRNRDGNYCEVRAAISGYFANSVANGTPAFPAALSADLFDSGTVPPTASGTYTWSYDPDTGIVSTN